MTYKIFTVEKGVSDNYIHRMLLSTFTQMTQEILRSGASGGRGSFFCHPVKKTPKLQPNPD